jgi:NDP-hexose-3-ketoreductase
MIKIGVLGCADIAKRLVIPNLISSGFFDVTAVASRTPEKAAEFAATFGCEGITGYNELLQREDIEAVYIPLPTGMHFEWVIKALEAGKHVLAEKSLAENLGEVEQIVALAKKKRLCVFENFMFVFHSQFAVVRKMLGDGEIGEIRLLRSSFGIPTFSAESNIRYKKELGGGALLDSGAYTIMAAHFLLGSKQEVIASSLENFGREVDFQGSAMLKNSAGTVSQLAFGFDNFYQNNIEIWGTKGKLFVERAFTAGPGFAPKLILEKQNQRTELVLSADNHFQKILLKFHNCIQTGDVEYMTAQLLVQSRLLTAVREMANPI